MWLKQVDQTHVVIFHKVASNRRHVNAITLSMASLNEDALISGLKRRVISVFEGYFRSDRRIHVESWVVIFPSLDQMDVELLEAPFTKEEFHRELMSAGGNKAPGPSMFIFEFVQTFQSDLKGELLSLFNQFFQMAKFDHRFSCSFILLISKVGSLTNLNDFRLISLLGWVHKLVTRTLAIRLQGIMGKLVQDMHIAFLKGKSIFEG